jgi:hypothetical protein
LERKKLLAAQPKRLFRYVCEELGLLQGENVVGKTLITKWATIAEDLGRSRSTAHEWGPPLVEAGLLRIEDDDQARTTVPQEKNGKVRFTVLSLYPGDGWYQEQADSQIRFAIMPDKQVSDSVDETRQDDREVSGSVDETRQDDRELSGSVDETRQDEANCRVSSTEPDTSAMQGIYIRACAVVDSVVVVATTTDASFWRSVKSLALEMSQKLFPRGLQPGVWQQLVAIAILAVKVVGRQWIDETLPIVAKKKARDKVEEDLIDYFIGTLRNKLKRRLFDPPEDMKSWFGKITYGLEKLGQAKCPSPPVVAPKVEKPSRPEGPSPEERAAAAARLNDDRATKLARLRGEAPAMAKTDRN